MEDQFVCRHTQYRKTLYFCTKEDDANGIKAIKEIDVLEQ